MVEWRNDRLTENRARRAFVGNADLVSDGILKQLDFAGILITKLLNMSGSNEKSRAIFVYRSFAWPIKLWAYNDRAQDAVK